MQQSQFNWNSFGTWIRFKSIIGSDSSGEGHVNRKVILGDFSGTIHNGWQYKSKKMSLTSIRIFPVQAWKAIWLLPPQSLAHYLWYTNLSESHELCVKIGPYISAAPSKYLTICACWSCLDESLFSHGFSVYWYPILYSVSISTTKIHYHH